MSMGVLTRGSIKREAKRRQWQEQHGAYCSCRSVKDWRNGYGEITAWHCTGCHMSQKAGDPCACMEKRHG
jgi:hypothetical protein